MPKIKMQAGEVPQLTSSLKDIKMIPFAQPESKYNEILETLNHFRITGDFTPFDLKRLKKEAEKIKEHADVAGGFGLLGMISLLEGDTESMHSYHKRAFEQSGMEAIHLSNYAGSLLIVGMYEDAYKYALKAYNKEPSDSATLDMVILCTCALNIKDKFENYAKKWSDVYKKDHYLKSQPLYLQGNIEPYYEFLRNHPDILKTCSLFNTGLIDCFGSPLNVITEIMPGLSYEDNLVGWIQWYGDINDGMERYERFEDWFINKGCNLKSDFLHFSVELVGE